SFILGWGLSYVSHTKSIQIEDRRVEESKAAKQAISATVQDTKIKEADKNGVPAYALEILEYILEHDEAPDGYVGGRIFQNREGLLPRSNSSGKKYQYREWDVHPKLEGQNRGTERLVTSNEQDVYFTTDHYRSFKKIK
ncbi:MAG: ribonuclease domain-containing protein, partial [Chitinophagales bacterium]